MGRFDALTQLDNKPVRSPLPEPSKPLQEAALPEQKKPESLKARKEESLKGSHHESQQSGKPESPISGNQAIPNTRKPEIGQA